MDSLMISYWFPTGFLMLLLVLPSWFPTGFLMVSYSFPNATLRVSYGFLNGSEGLSHRNPDFEQHAFKKGEKKISKANEYNSHNTKQLNEKELIKTLLDLTEIDSTLKAWGLK